MPAGPQTTSYFNKANDALSMTPQEQYLYQYHLDNLYGDGKVVRGKDVSTILQAIVQGRDGKFYNIPTVWGGRIYSPEEAAIKASKTGFYKFPSYDSPDEADARYMKMHDFMDRDVGAYLSQENK